MFIQRDELKNKAIAGKKPSKVVKKKIGSPTHLNKHKKTKQSKERPLQLV